MAGLFVDPGSNACGVALFTTQGELTGCALVRNGYAGKDLATRCTEMSRAVVSWWLSRFPNVNPLTLIVELPRVYQGGKQKGDPNDLIAVAAVAAGIVVSLGEQGRFIYPRDWKGTIDGDAMTARIREHMTPAETRMLKSLSLPPSLEHNVIDAIGIGHHHHKRGRVRVYPR